MKVLWKKGIAAMLALLMACGAGGCTDSGELSTDTTSSAGSSAEDDAWIAAATDPLTPYPETVTVTFGKEAGRNFSALAGTEWENHNDDDNAMYDIIGGFLNIDIQIDFVGNGGDDYNKKVAMAIADGNIPDVMKVSDYSTLKQLVESDMVEDLTQAFEDCATDRIRDIYDSFDGRCLESGKIDGKLYGIPATNIFNGQELLWLRKDWLDKLNLEEPETMEDIEYILQQFVEQDPGNNGEGKTIGLVVNTGIAGAYGAQFQLNGIFTHYGAAPGQWIEKDGEVVYGSVQPEMKEALTVLRDWYAKGLIDPQVAVRTNDDRIAVVANGQCGAFFGAWWSCNSPASDAWALDNSVEWVPCVVPVGEDGKVTVIEQNPSMGYLVVRKGFEHPEVAVKLVSLQYDYMRRSDYVQSDVEKAYIAGDVACGFLGNCDFNNALVLCYENIRDILDGKSPEDATAFEYGVAASCQKYVDAIDAGQLPDKNDWSNYYGRMIGTRLAAEVPYNKISPVFYGSTDTMKLRWGSLQKMESEMLLRIVLNEDPIDSFDSFVEEWYASGGDTITEEVSAEVAK